MAKARRKRKRQHTRKAAKPGFLRRLLRATPVMLLLIVLVMLFGRLGVLHKFETITLDAEARLNTPPANSSVAIVNIVDDDYDNLFGSTSPLHPDKLRELIDAIAKGQPKVIGVDIDTSDTQFRDGLRVPPSWPPVVWERVVKDLPESTDEKPEPLSVLGGSDPARDRDSGLALLIQDSEDKVVRRYQRLIDTAEGPLPSFAWSIMQKFAPDKTAALDERAAPLLIKFSGDREGSHRLEFTAAKLLDLAPSWEKAPASSPLYKKIVLLGGSYRGQDRHDTPLGKMIGVRVIANVIETELDGGGYGPPGKVTVALLEIFDGFVLLLLFHFLTTARATAISMVIIPLLALVCSFISFGSFSRWAYFAPVLLGVLLFELYNHYRHHAIPHLYEEISGAGGHEK